MKPRLIHEDGRVDMVKPRTNAKFTLTEICNLLGCNEVKILSTPISGKYMVVDKDGESKEANFTASGIMKEVIVGKVIICEKQMI